MFPNLNTYDNIGLGLIFQINARERGWNEGSNLDGKHIPNHQLNEFNACPLDDMHVNTPSI
jgi:hypothetical protein